MAKTSLSTPSAISRTRGTAGASAIAHLPRRWLRRLRQRHELSMLSPEQLRDVGLDPRLVLRESRKPFWLA